MVNKINEVELGRLHEAEFSGLPTSGVDDKDDIKKQNCVGKFRRFMGSLIPLDLYMEARLVSVLADST